MDQFLKDINSLVYFKWISYQKLSGIKIKQVDDDGTPTVSLEAKNAIATVRSYPNNIFEEEVVDKKNNDSIFYIHFQMANMKHAVDLFKEMIDCVYESSSQPLGKILLCCSGGMTTTFFANNMQKLAELEKLNYKVTATGYGHLYEIAHDYDIVLLAPQVSYILPTLRKNLPDIIVEALPTKYFAMDDYKSALNYAIERLEK